MAGAKLSHVEKRKIQELLEVEGLSVARVARRLNRSQGTIYSYREQLVRGVEPPSEPKPGSTGPGSRPRLSYEEKAKIRELVEDEQMSVTAVARVMGRSRGTIYAYLTGKPRNGDEVRAKREMPTGSAEPRPTEQLSEVARDCLDDFARFRARYFGRLATPWQEEAANRVVELLATPNDEYVVVNCPPGSGKSTLFTTDIPAWLTVRDRAVRGLLGHATQQISSSYCNRLKRTFERVHPGKAKDRDIRLGLAVDAEASLVQDYGAFKPRNPEIWKRDQFTVWQLGETPSDEKESTWTAFGMDSGFLGWRVDFIIWDDLVTGKTMRSQESIMAMREWWEDEAETRLEPGGLLVLQGQRLRGDDLYRYCLDMLATDELDLPAGEDEDQPVAAKKYHHIVFKAHYEDRCEGDHDPHEAVPYPGGCLLDPKRLSWRKLKAIKANRASKFRVVYQQEDVDPESVLVPTLWVNGGRGLDGADYPGCWDKDRQAGELPRDVIGRKLSVMSVDPSPTKMWSVQWWVYNEPPGVEPLAGFRYLMDHHLGKMTAPEFLDWAPSLNMFTGMAEDWWQRSKGSGSPITHLIFEANAAQRFLLQYDFFRRWAQSRGVLLIPHQTQRNKLDPDMGLQMVQQQWRLGRIRLPGASPYGRLPSLRLVDQVTRYNLDGSSQSDDAVMAHWFTEHHLPKLWGSGAKIGSIYGDMPSWVKRRTDAA